MFWLMFLGYILGIGATVGIMDNKDIEEIPYLPFIWPFALLIYLGWIIPHAIKNSIKGRDQKKLISKINVEKLDFNDYKEVKKITDRYEIDNNLD